MVCIWKEKINKDRKQTRNGSQRQLNLKSTPRNSNSTDKKGIWSLKAIYMKTRKAVANIYHVLSSVLIILYIYSSKNPMTPINCLPVVVVWVRMTPLRFNIWILWSPDGGNCLRIRRYSIVGGDETILSLSLSAASTPPGVPPYGLKVWALSYLL